MTSIKIRRTPEAGMPVPSFEREVDRFLTQPPGLFQFPFGRLFAPLFSFASPTKEFTWLPAAEMTEVDDTYFITAEVPGLKTDDIKIEYADGVLTISGEKKEEKKEEDARYYTFERSYGWFERAFGFPAAVKAEKIAATVTNGVLKVEVPKAAAQKVEAKKIAVTEGK
jgi:HSP20 family protein